MRCPVAAEARYFSGNPPCQLLAGSTAFSSRFAAIMCRCSGIIDEHGKRLSKELPPDMQSGAQRDFGG